MCAPARVIRANGGAPPLVEIDSALLVDIEPRDDDADDDDDGDDAAAGGTLTLEIRHRAVAGVAPLKSERWRLRAPPRALVVGGAGADEAGAARRADAAFNDEPLRRIKEEIERAKREARAEHIKGVFGPDCGIDFNSI